MPDYSNCTVDFVTNDYLGMARKSQVIASHIVNAGLGSRLIAGNSKEAIYCEDFLAELFQVESALVFNSGYDANLGFFSTIPQKDEIVLFDKAIHASVRDGLRLSAAKSYSFNHNDLQDLEEKLIRFQGSNVFVVIEGVYSMDGDKAPIDEILQLAQVYKAYVVVDEAHSLGVEGENGLGLAEKYFKHPNLLARIITFGKAIGAHGAAVLSNRDLKKYLIHACRSFIYTTALAPSAYVRIKENLEFVYKNRNLRDSLDSVTQCFAHRFNLPNQHIQMIPMNGITRIRQIMNLSAENNIALKGVWSPTVPEGEERLRISLHSFNTEKEINQLYHFLEIYLNNE